MKSLILAATLVASALTAIPATAMVIADGFHTLDMQQSFDRRGRRPRTLGGSGCDGAGDAGKPGC